jgi:hypothetical protein
LEGACRNTCRRSSRWWRCCMSTAVG